MIPQWLALPIVMAAAFGAAVVRGATGFAQALAILPVGLFFYSPLVMVPVVLILSAEVALMFLGKYGREHDWVAVRQTELLRPSSLFVLVPGMAVGATLLGAFPEDRIRQFIGLIVFLAALLYIAMDISVHQNRRRRRETPSRRRLLLARVVTCAASGVTQGFAGIGGPPVVFFLLWRGVGPETFIVTFSALFMLADLFRFVDYGLRGYWTPEVLYLSVSLTPATILGFLMGDWLRRRFLRPEIFRRVVLGVLILVALRLMMRW